MKGGFEMAVNSHENRICSLEYQEFMNVSSGYYRSEKELCAAMSKALIPIAKMLHIGFLSVHLEAPKSMLAPNGQLSEMILFDNHERRTKAHMKKYQFETAERGTFLIVIYPESDYVWSRSEQNDLKFLASNIFLLGSRTRMYKLLIRAYTTDYMTSAMNTQGLMSHGERLFSSGRLSDYTGVFMNLKNFKYINSKVGQSKGDEILISYCHKLQEALLPDERLARPGGDNFFALIRKERAEMFLSLIREVKVSILFHGEKMSFSVHCHAGAYNIKEGEDLNTAMNCCTIALNAVKHSGKATDQAWYDPSMKEKAMHDKQISQLFPEALMAEEFLVYYQPKVNLGNRKLCGCEALVRWFHNGAVVPPMDFIPVLEREGTVCKLDFYVFEHVCRDIRNWLDRGIEPVRVSVNFSQQHLQNSRLSEQIVSIMHQYHVDSKYIEVELTEMSGSKNHDALLEFLRKMRDNGICTSIDDFGTGYSSLNMLREFKADIIKLDKSFIDRISLNVADYRVDEIVIENIIRMAQELNLEIISEGVETSHQAEFLKRVHCNMAQGFLFDKPLPHDEFEKRLKGSRIYSLSDKK